MNVARTKKSLEMIDFSTRNFYNENELKMGVVMTVWDLELRLKCYSWFSRRRFVRGVIIYMLDSILWSRFSVCFVYFWISHYNFRTHS